LLRSEPQPSADDIARAIAGIWGQREDRYSEQRAALREQGIKKIEMSYIGG
jgi:cyclic pyranopterin phosphate synthase